jgi:hypothetical protein
LVAERSQGSQARRTSRQDPRAFVEIQPRHAIRELVLASQALVGLAEMPSEELLPHLLNSLSFGTPGHRLLLTFVPSSKGKFTLTLGGTRTSRQFSERLFFAHHDERDQRPGCG